MNPGEKLKFKNKIKIKKKKVKNFKVEILKPGKTCLIQQRKF